MKRLHRIILFVMSLAGFGLSIGLLSQFAAISFVNNIVNRFQISFVNDVFAVYSAVICLFSFLIVLFVLLYPNKSNDMVLKKDRGILRFSKQTVESTIRYSFMDVSGINFSKVKVKIKRQPEKSKVYVKLSLSDLGNLLELTETVQSRIESMLKSSLGINAKSINIKVAGANNEAAPVAEPENRVV